MGLPSAVWRVSRCGSCSAARQVRCGASKTSFTKLTQSFPNRGRLPSEKPQHSGHSPRDGMTVDLAVECDLPLLMQAGRWSRRRSARYTRNQRAAHGGVAQWCAKRSL